jgi:hypothetical protein
MQPGPLQKSRNHNIVDAEFELRERSELVRIWTGPDAGER